MLSIKIKDDQAAFGPGDTIEGIASWRLTEDPEHVRLYLIWYTEGKGDEDTAIVDHIELAGAERQGEKPFSIALPEGPYSFEGKLIALQWALELVSLDPVHVERTTIMVSPWVKKVILDTSEDDAIELGNDDD